MKKIYLILGINFLVNYTLLAQQDSLFVLPQHVFKFSIATPVSFPIKENKNRPKLGGQYELLLTSKKAISLSYEEYAFEGIEEIKSSYVKAQYRYYFRKPTRINRYFNGFYLSPALIYFNEEIKYVGKSGKEKGLGIGTSIGYQKMILKRLTLELDWLLIYTLVRNYEDDLGYKETTGEYKSTSNIRLGYKF